MVERAARRHRRPARQPLHAPAAPGHGLRQPPVRRRAVARRAGRLLRADARRMAGIERPGRRQRRLPGARAPGTCTTTSTPTARSCSAASRAARSARCRSPARPASSRPSSTPDDPVHTPRGLNIANPAVEQSLADAVTDLRRRGHPARRAAARLAVRAPRRRADPDPRRPRQRRRLQRDQRRLGRLRREPRLPERAARLELRDGDAVHRRRCPVDTRTILTYSQSTEPELALLRRPDADVLQQAVGRRGLLRGRDRGRPEPPGDGDLRAGPATRARRARRRCACPLVPAYRASARRPTARTGRRSRSPRAPRRPDVGQPDRRDARRRTGRPRTSIGFVRLGVQVGAPGAPETRT